MRKLFLFLSIILFIACSQQPIPTPTPEPVVEEILYEQVVDNGKIYSSKDFFDVGFNEYKEYNVSKLTGSTEAWYGYWGTDEDNVKYYELRFYPDHSTAVSDGTAFAEDDTGEEAKLDRKETMWKVGLTDRKMLGKGHGGEFCARNTGSCQEIPKYFDYLTYNNVILLCWGFTSNESLETCWNLVDMIEK